jgi:hypothetical protein
MVDLSAVATPRQLERILERSLILRLFDLTAMNAALDRANGKRGTGTLRSLLARLSDVPPPTRNELERRFLEVVRDAGLAPPVVNSLVCGYEVARRTGHR